MTAELDQLIDRLGMLTAPDLAIDAEIARSQGAHTKPIEEINPNMYDKRGLWMQAVDFGGTTPGWVYVPPYTSSIDAALMLLPPEWKPVHLAFPQAPGHAFWFDINPPDEHPAWVRGTVHESGATAALATVRAMLEAQRRDTIYVV